MAVLSNLTDTIPITAMDAGDKKGKLIIVAVAVIGLVLLLRRRSSSSEEGEDSEEETETESEDEETMTEDIESEAEDGEAEEIEEITSKTAEVRRELDVFDMLAILAAAIKAARDEYNQRADA